MNANEGKQGKSKQVKEKKTAKVMTESSAKSSSVQEEE
jgi:hypothetical protein